MLLPMFTPDVILPPGDYPMTLEDPRHSSLVTGAGNPSETWDRAWRERLASERASG